MFDEFMPFLSCLGLRLDSIRTPRRGPCDKMLYASAMLVTFRHAPTCACVCVCVCACVRACGRGGGGGGGRRGGGGGGAAGGRGGVCVCVCVYSRACLSEGVLIMFIFNAYNRRLDRKMTDAFAGVWNIAKVREGERGF